MVVASRHIQYFASQTIAAHYEVMLDGALVGRLYRRPWQPHRYRWTFALVGQAESERSWGSRSEAATALVRTVDPEWKGHAP